MKSGEKNQSKTKTSTRIHFGPETRYYQPRRDRRRWPRESGNPYFPYDDGDGSWDEFDEILGNFGDWGSQ